MNTPLIDPQEWIKQAPAGTCVQSIVELDGERRVAIFIREDVVQIAALSNPPVELRAGLFLEKAAVVVVLALSINSELYETWWNYHQPDGQDLFELMIQQAHLPILFFSGRKMERSIQISNQQAEFFQLAKAASLARSVWEMRAFDLARKGMEHKYPTVKKLWRALKSIG